jgi:hypothetical protein
MSQLLEIRVEEQQIILNGDVILDIVHGISTLTYLQPRDWEAFWHVWHDHKTELKAQGFSVFMKMSLTAPKWYVCLKGNYYVEKENSDESEQV